MQQFFKDFFAPEPKMGPFTRTMKIFLITFNLFIMFWGLVLVFIGVVFLVDWKPVKDSFKNFLTVAPLVYILFGIIMFLIAAFGFWGAYRENRRMLRTYMYILIAIIIVQVIVAIIFLTSRESPKTRIINIGRGLFEVAPKVIGLRTITNTVQRQFECCGWYDIEYYGYDWLEALPDSCCPQNSPSRRLFEGKCTREYASPACEKRVSEFVETHRDNMAGVAIGVLIVEVVCIIFALFLLYFLRGRIRSQEESTRSKYFLFIK